MEQDHKSNLTSAQENQDSLKNSTAGTDRLPRHSLTQKELEYLCNRGGKNTPSYVGEYVDPDIEV